MVHLMRLAMPLTSTIDSTAVPFSSVSGSVLRQTRWMVSHSLKRERSDAQSQACSGERGTSTETEILAIGQILGSPWPGEVGPGGVGPAFFVLAFLAASCTLSTVLTYLPCVFLSTM